MIRTAYPGSGFFFHSESGSRDQKALVSRPGSVILIARNHLCSQGCGFGPPWTGCQRCFSKMDQIQIRILASRVDRYSTVQSQVDIIERVLNDPYEDQAFSPSYDLAPRKLDRPDTQEDWEREKAGRRGGRERAKSRIIRPHESMVIHKSFNTILSDATYEAKVMNLNNRLDANAASQKWTKFGSSSFLR
jgi:hypothetical protein